MKTKELKILIAAAEALGHTDIEIVLIDGRDGQEEYQEATARLIKTGCQKDPHVVIGFTYA